MNVCSIKDSKGVDRRLIKVSATCLNDVADELDGTLPDTEFIRTVTCHCPAGPHPFWVLWTFTDAPRIKEFIISLGYQLLEVLAPEQAGEKYLELAYIEAGADPQAAVVFASWQVNGIDPIKEGIRVLNQSKGRN